MNRNIIISNEYNNTPILVDITAISSKYIAHISHHKALSTVKTYDTKLKAFLAWFTTAKIIGTIKDQLGEYRSFVREKYHTAKSRNIMLSVVRSFYKWLFENDYIDHDPTTPLKNFKGSDEGTKTGLNKYQLHDKGRQPWE